MVSFMGRAGASAGAAARALTGVVRSSQESRSNQSGERNKDYLSILTLRGLHRQLVAALEDYNSSIAADTGGIISNGESDAESGVDRRRDNRGGISGYIGGKGRVRVSTPAEIARKEVRLVEIIRGISELVALGEAREEPEYFEFFCEMATMVLFVSALRLGTAVKIQVVQSVAILFQNLQSTIHIYMLLSQDHINRLIEPDASSGAASVLLPLHDEEFLANYVALLKAISVRLSPDTVQFFVNTSKGSFPLYSQSVPLIAHPDPLVRTSALSIVLHVFSVRDPGVSAFLALEENHNDFFEQLARLLQDTYSQLLCRADLFLITAFLPAPVYSTVLDDIRRPPPKVWQNHEPPFSSSSEGLKAINESTSLFQDMLYYVQDVLEAADSWLSERLAAHLHQAFFRPVVLEGLAEALDVCPHGDDEGDREEEEESEAGVVEKEREDRLAEAQVSLYALCQFYMVVNNGALVDLVTSDLFGCGSSSKLSEALEAKGDMKGENREAILRPENVESGKDTQQGTKLSQSSVGESAHAVGFRYRRALLACLSKRGGGRGQKCLRLGTCVSAGVSVLRCAANNPAAAGAVLRDRGVSNQGAWGTGPQGEENRKRLLSGSDSPVGVVGSRGSRGGRAAEGTVLGGRCLDYDDNDNRGGIGDEASGACNGDRGGGVSEERAGNDCFEQVMMHLLETIADDSKINYTQPVLNNLQVKKNASAAIAELCVLDISSGDESVRGGGGKRGGGVRIGPWRASKRLEHHRLGEALTRAYAQSAAVLLQATRQRSPPLALLTACKRAVELLGVGAVRVNGDVELSTPLPPLVEMAASGLLLGTSVVKTAVAEEWDGGVALVQSAVAFLILRHLHRWLVEGTWTPSSPAASIRVDSEFLSLVGVDLAPQPATVISRADGENETSLTSSSSPTVGDRIRLSSRRCIACRLPYNWPASVAFPPSVKERSSDASAKGVAHLNSDSLEIYVVLDNHNFFVASPDPDSPLDDGLLLCATPLRNAVAKAHPANPRVLEVRVSTQEAGQEGAGGPGLFLSTTNGSPRNLAEAGSRWEEGVIFRGVGHRGLWHLVLSFQSNAACTLVAEHVTEQREAALAAQTVGMVEMLRITTTFLTASENSYPSER